jgi:hypothetical protein
MVDGFSILGTVAGNGVRSVFGTQMLAAFILVFLVVGALAWVGLDIVADICLGGLLALGLGYAGWLPMPVTQVIVLIIWGLGFGYFILIFYGR